MSGVRLKTVAGWALVLVAGVAFGLPLWLAALLLALALGAPALRRRRRRRAVLEAPLGAVRGSVEPPFERQAWKPPTTLATLGVTLEASRLGPVTTTHDALRVGLEGGGWAVLTAALPDAVTQRTVALAGDSMASVALLCDALAGDLGVMRLEVEGATLVIDGTRPRGLLLRDVARAWESRRPAPPPPPAHLN